MTHATQEASNALDCPNKNCIGGEVSWRCVQGRNFLEFDYGLCDSCGTPAGRCPHCDEITAIDGRTKCDGCLGRYEEEFMPGEPDPASVTWWIPADPDGD